MVDPVSGKKVRLSFPLSGSIRDKNQQIREIDNKITACKLAAKMAETRALIFEAEAARRAMREADGSLIWRLREIRNETGKRLDAVYPLYKKTAGYKAVSPTTQHQRGLRWPKFVDFCAAKNVDTFDGLQDETVRAFFESLECKASTHNKYLADFSSMVKACGLPNVFACVTRKNAEADATPKQAFTPLEVELILSRLSGEWLEVCRIAARTGLRFKDCVMLRRDQIVEGENVPWIIHLVPAKTTHSGRALNVHLVQELQYLLDAPTKNGYFFPKLKKQYNPGSTHAGSSLNHLFNRRLRALGIKGKTFHCFRHYFVDHLRRGGLTDEQIGSVVGHASTKQTRDYGEHHAVFNLENIG